MAITWLAAPTDSPFPPVSHATDHGLLAAGGDLSPDRLLKAYQSGIFPWFNAQDPVLWWSPDPRMVLYTDRIKITKSLRKTIRQQRFQLTVDTAFVEVMHACAAPRSNDHDSSGTWIHDTVIAAYRQLHQQGHAHSIECWQDKQLVGGLYGVAIGRMFFGESMFSFQPDASKTALAGLCRQLQRWGMPLIDCQVYSSHLERMGGQNLPRAEFIQQLEQLCHLPGPAHWQFDQDLWDSL